MVNLLNMKVKHSAFGVGVVTEQDDKYITVEFAAKTSKFAYPTAFEKFIKAEDENVQNTIASEIEEIKAAEKAKKAAEAEKRAAEEMARLEEIRTQSKSGKKSSDSKGYVPVKRVVGQALTYLVFQGDTFPEESRGQFIWAPKYTKGGGTCHHWDRLMDVREGDVILHCSAGYIQAISKVKAPYEESARPDMTTGDWTQWEKDGRRVDCDYHVLATPLKHGAYKETIQQYCNVKYAPFDKDGNGNMGYLFDINADLAAFFIKEIAKKNPEVVDLDFLGFLLIK